MPLLKLALVLFSFQTIVFFCISGFNDDLSLSTTVTNFWSNLIHGSINKAYHLEVPPDFKQDIWIYLFLSVFRCLCNFTTASNKLRTRTDNIQLLQFLLGSTLSCYLFFLDLWLSTSRGFENGFVILPILSFISMEIDFSILARWLGFGAAYIFQIICAIGSVSIFYAHHGCYWLFIPYILIPAFDIFKTIFQSTWTKCDPSMYFEHLLPSFLIIAYVKPLSGTYVLLNPPETKVVDTCGIFLVLGLLLMAAKSIIFKFYAYNQRIKNRFVIQRPCNDEKCSICLEKLVKRVHGKTSVLSSPNYCCASLNNLISYLLELTVKKNKNQNMIVLKTPCNHLFHEKCLEKWISNRPECPYCRKELINFL